MERYNVMQQLKWMYEKILESGDAKNFMKQEAEIDELFDILQLKATDGPYNQQELESLHDLVQLNDSMKSLLSSDMKQMEVKRNMSPKISQQYDTPAFTDSYFFDKKL